MLNTKHQGAPDVDQCFAIELKRGDSYPTSWVRPIMERKEASQEKCSAHNWVLKLKMGRFVSDSGSTAVGFYV